MLVRNISLGMGNSFGRIGHCRYDKRPLRSAAVGLYFRKPARLPASRYY
jgi:hypothetical protein